MAVRSGWGFRALAGAFDVIVGRVFGLVGRLFGRSLEAYGPTPSVLSRILGRRSLVLLTSQQDEAGVALQLGAAPERLYEVEVQERLTGVRRLFEFLFLRPFVKGIVIKGLEVVLERYVLGFSWVQVMFGDYEMADLDRSRAYPSKVVERVDVTGELRPTLEVLEGGPDVGSPLAPRPALPAGPDRKVKTFRETLHETSEYLKKQLQLRHSLYYESEAVIARVADELVDRQGSSDPS